MHESVIFFSSDLSRWQVAVAFYVCTYTILAILLPSFQRSISDQKVERFQYFVTTLKLLLPLRPILQHTQYFASCPFVWKSVAKEGRGYLSCDRHCAKFPSSSPYPLFLLAASSSSSDFHSWCVPETRANSVFNRVV